MHWNEQVRADRGRELRGLLFVEVADDPPSFALGIAAVDRKQGDVDA
jgi:hypothetical protein